MPPLESERCLGKPAWASQFECIAVINLNESLNYGAHYLMLSATECQEPLALEPSLL